MTENRINECKNMINALKENAKSMPSSKYKQSTLIKNVNVDSFLFVMNEVLKILDYMEGEKNDV